jgi:4'-phosphopantetheinyl transferase
MTASHEPPRWVKADLQPVLADGELHIWQWSLDVSEDELPGLTRLLSPDERERAARFRFEKDSRNFTVGRGILRSILGRYLDQKAEDCVFVYGVRGKPFLPGTSLRFNLAHSSGRAVLAVARGRAVGIDIECIRLAPDWAGIMNSFFSSVEREGILALPSADRPRAFFTCWTRKEAYLKATGEGIGTPLDSFDVTVIPGSEPRLLRVDGSPREVTRWQFHELPLEGDFVGVAAIEGPCAAVQHFLWQSLG